MTKIKKISINIEVYIEDNVPFVEYNMSEDSPSMRDIGLLLYKIKQLEQDLIDRDWDIRGEGYEIDY